MHSATHMAVIDTHEGNPAAGQEVKPGDVIPDFRGDKWRFVGITRLPNGASTGRVYVEDLEGSKWKQEFFPSVFDLIIVPR